MFKYMSVGFVALLIFSFTCNSVTAQASNDAETYKEIEQYEKEQTIEVVNEDKNSSERLNVETGMLASSLSGVEAITSSDVSADSGTFRKLGDEVTDPEKVKSEKQKFENIPSLGVADANDFFEGDESKSGSANATGGQCSTPGTAVY